MAKKLKYNVRLLKPKRPKNDTLCISLRLLCEKHGKIQWEQPIINRIMSDLDEYPLDDETLYDLIDYDLKSKSVVLKARGVYYWLDILTGYFDKDSLLDVARYMRNIENSNRKHFQIEYFNKIAEYILTWSKLSKSHLNKVMEQDKDFKSDVVQFVNYDLKSEMNRSEFGRLNTIQPLP